MFRKLIFDYARKCKEKLPNGARVYGSLRNRNNVKGLVIHYTGGTKDTAKNECDFFATGIDRQASAHIFIDYEGLTGRSLPLNRIAFSVGNPNGAYKKGSYYAMLSNANTVSIELCAISGRPVSAKQKKALLKVCKWVKKKCPNIKYVVRHYDIVQKNCPEWYVEHNKDWLKLQSEIMTAIGV